MVRIYNRVIFFIKSRFQVIRYNDKVELDELRQQIKITWNIGDKHVFIVKDYDGWAVRLYNRISDILYKLIPNKSFSLFVLLEPYSIKHEKLGFKSGIGWYMGDWGAVVVAYSSLLHREEFPYLEHEIAHAVGILKNDHSNLKELIKAGILKR